MNSTSGLHGTESTNESLLLYEKPDGNITALLKVQVLCREDIDFCSDNGPTTQYWVDISKNNKSLPLSEFSPISPDVTDNGVTSRTLYDLSPGAILRTPFVSGATYPVTGSELNVQLVVCDEGTDQSISSNPDPLCNSLTTFNYESWTNATHGHFTQGMYD